MTSTRETAPLTPERRARRLMLRWLAYEGRGSMKSTQIEHLVCDTYAHLSGHPATTFHKWLYERGRG